MIRPLQRLPKSKKDKEWRENCIRYYSTICIPAMDAKKADVLFRAANGELDQEDYVYVTNPRNSDNPNYTRFPSKIRNFDIISPNIMLLMGEKRRRGLDYTVVPINSNIEDERKELQDQLVNQYLTQELLNQIVAFQMQQGQQPDIEQDQQLTAEAIKKKVASLQDKLAIQGQTVLDYIREYTSLDSKFAESFYYWLVTGRTFSYKEPRNDEVEFSIVSIKEMYYHANNRTRFLKDADAIKRRMKCQLTEIVDKFQGVEDFTDDILKDLESKVGSFSDGFSSVNNGFVGFTDKDYLGMNRQTMSGSMLNKLRGSEQEVYDDQDGVAVEHIVWTSEVKVGEIIVPNLFGEPEKEYVDEDYDPIDGEEVNWIWKPQKWEGWLIDNQYIVGVGPIEYSTGSIDKCENPYNGRIFDVKHVNPKSTVEKMLDYQIKNNIVHYYIEKTFAKNKDKITVFPIGLLPEDKNIDMEAAMYYADAMGFLFVDESKGKNVQAALNSIKTIDAGLSQHISQLYDYLRIIRNECDAIVGINDQRKGQMNSSDGKATTENSVFRSSIMTEELFTQHDELEETDLNGLMEISKIAFADGKRTMFIRGTKNETTLLDIDSDFSFEKYLIKAKNAGKNLRDLEMAKANAQALTQNKNGRFSDVIKVIKSDNISELLQEMEQVEDAFEQAQQAQAQQQMQMQQESDDKKLKIAEMNLQASNYRADRIYDGTVEAATIKAETMLDLDKFNAPDTAGQEIATLEANTIKRQEVQNKQALEEKRLQAENNKTKTDAETKKYVADKHLEAAKITKNKNS